MLEQATTTACPLVLLHGLGVGPGAWTEQTRRFAVDRQVLAPAILRPGADKAPFSIERAASELRAGLHERGLTRVDVCGFSVGGQVALWLAAAEPRLVRRLIVCAGYARLSADMRSSALETAAELRALPDTLFQQTLHHLVVAVPDAYRGNALQALAELSPDALACVMAEAARFDITPRLSSFRLPTLIVCGDQDRWNLPLSQRLAATVLGAVFETVPNAGHFAFLDQPELFAQAVRRFLDEDHRIARGV